MIPSNFKIEVLAIRALLCALDIKGLKIQDSFLHLRFTLLRPSLPFLNPIEDSFSVVKSRVKNLNHHEVENCTAARDR